MAYDGSAYHGWQVQPNALTVQEVMENTLTTLLQDKISVTGAGRTDSGVHARNYYLHFDTATNTSNLVHRLNRFLPEDIAVFNLYQVSLNAHARYDAIKRRYAYYIRDIKYPFDRNYTWQVPYRLDIEKMNSAADILKEYSDFTSFSKLHSDTASNECKIYEAKWQEEAGLMVFRIAADRFLRNMVRAVTGSLVEVGRGKIPPQSLHEIIASKDRGAAGQSVPARALFLENIEYPHQIFEPNE